MHPGWSRPRGHRLVTQLFQCSRRPRIKPCGSGLIGRGPKISAPRRRAPHARWRFPRTGKAAGRRRPPDRSNNSQKGSGKTEGFQIGPSPPSDAFTLCKQNPKPPSLGCCQRTPAPRGGWRHRKRCRHIGGPLRSRRQLERRHASPSPRAAHKSFWA